MFDATEVRIILDEFLLPGPHLSLSSSIEYHAGLPSVAVHRVPLLLLLLSLEAAGEGSIVTPAGPDVLLVAVLGVGGAGLAVGAQLYEVCLGENCLVGAIAV